MAKGCALSTGNLPRGGLPRNIVDRITDLPDMTSAVDHGRKASTQTKPKNLNIFMEYYVMIEILYNDWQFYLTDCDNSNSMTNLHYFQMRKKIP